MYSLDISTKKTKVMPFKCAFSLRRKMITDQNMSVQMSHLNCMIIICDMLTNSKY
jgi:hypothetical protein